MSEKSRTPLVRISAQVSTVLFAAVMVLQLLLATGVMPVSMAWGGRQTELTPGLRVASLVAVVILGFFAYIIRRRAGLIGSGEIKTPIKILAWVITAYMAFNLLGNITSQSAGETMIFGPITAILTIACLIVSASKTTVNRYKQDQNVKAVH
jgi:hypothetical protein